MGLSAIALLLRFYVSVPGRELWLPAARRPVLGVGALGLENVGDKGDFDETRQRLALLVEMVDPPDAGDAGFLHMAGAKRVERGA